MLFFKKKEYITIVVDKETNFNIQRFADKRNIKRLPVSVTKSADKYMVIGFWTKYDRERVSKELKKEFGHLYKVEIKEHLMFVTES